MKIEWDFDELYEFAEKLSDTHNFQSEMMAATRKIAKVLHYHLLQHTPVDTGNLRKMWSAGDNLKFTVEPTSEGLEVTLINTARAKSADGYMYGVAVNDGHKTPSGTGWVMGRFFVEKSIILTEPQIEQIVMKKLQKWWDSV